MSEKEREKVVRDMVKVLSDHGVSFSEVDLIIEDMKINLDELAYNQTIGA